MPDYKEMYLIMMRAVERASNLLIEAQQKCEELYLQSTDPNPASPAAPQAQQDKP